MNETENQKENFRQRCAVLQDENASEGFTVPMEETATKKRGNKKTRIALVIALSLVLLAVIALGGVSVYYRSAFLPGTVINGYDCSGVSEAGAAEFLLGTAKSHTAQLRDAQGDAVVALPLESFVDTDGFTAALEEYFDAQHAEAGLFGWMTKGERSLETGVYSVSDTAAASELLSRVLYDETPRQAPVIAAIVAVVGLLIWGNMKIGYPRFGAVQERLDRLNGVAREFLSSVRVVKAFRAESAEKEKFEGASFDLAAANAAALRTMAIFSPLINLTVNFGIVLLLWLSRNQRSAEIGRLMASVNYMTQVLFSVTMISNALNAAVRAAASSRRIEEVLQETPAQRMPAAPQKPEIRGEIRFEHVSFSYAGAGRESLRDIDFHIRPGETIGIIGPTGSGKTTLVNLVPRFYDATQGTVWLDGCDVTQIDTKWLRDAVAVVPQKALLFSGKICENLRWGRADASDEELRAAAKAACAEEFIEASAQGYDTLLDQGGVNLSGGQKQRLSIARALVRRPRILILDDCTSALDAQTEAAVLRGLKSAADGTTVLLISQRVSTVMRADRILCLDNGALQGFGTHAELLASCETYRAIYRSQIGGAENG